MKFASLHELRTEYSLWDLIGLNLLIDEITPDEDKGKGSAE